MSRTARLIREKLVAPAFDERPANLRAELLDYYPDLARAKIRILFPGTTHPVVLDNVPLRVPPSGLAEGAPRPGDGCYVSFYGDLSKLYIIGFYADERPRQIVERMNKKTAGGELPRAASRWENLNVAESSSGVTGTLGGTGLGGQSFAVR